MNRYCLVLSFSIDLYITSGQTVKCKGWGGIGQKDKTSTHTGGYTAALLILTQSSNL